MKRVLKYQIPVNDNIWEEKVKGRIVHVDYQTPGMVTFWTESLDSEDAVFREFAVYGTGHSVPGDLEYVGTCIDRFTSMVWHLYERKLPDA